MRAAIRTLKTALVVSLAAAGGCEQSQPDQNITIENASPSEIEALPPDESSAADLENGADNADSTDLTTTNSE
jgi:hypothetical protein